MQGRGQPQHRVKRHPARECRPTVRAARRASQRERLLSAITQLAISGSPHELTVGQIVARAGVSRPTFYEYFTDREDCFLHALRPGAQELLASVEQAVCVCEPQHAPAEAAHALIAFARERPGMARLLTSDCLAGGRACLDARDRLIEHAAQIISDAVDRAGKDSAIAAISPRLLLGVTSRLLAVRLDRGEDRFLGFDAELSEWLAGYWLRPAQRAQQIRPIAPNPAPNQPISAQLRPPPALSHTPGRVPDRALSENQWLRTVFATAAIVARDGYAAATAAEITRAACLDNRAFYRLFSCKEQALAGARELMFGHVMAVTAGAFATAECWPERIWEAARAFTDCVRQNPTLAYVCFVESHAGGPVAMARLPQLIGAFTIFLQEGYRDRLVGPGSPAPPSPVALEAIVTAVFELCHLHARRPDEQAGSQPGELAFICLAPFLGAGRAHDFLAHKRSAEDCSCQTVREPAQPRALEHA